MEYDVQFICCFCKIMDTERKCIKRKHRQNHMSDNMEPLAKKKVSKKEKKVFNYGCYKKRKNYFPDAVKN